MENINDLAFEFGCKVSNILSIYLDLPMSALFKSMKIWDGMEEWFCKRLAL